MVLMFDEPADNSTGDLQITKRLIQTEGIRVYDRFYFHSEMTAYRGQAVEVRYDAGNSSRIDVVLPDLRVVEAETIEVVRNDEEFVDNAFELMQYKAANRALVAALYESLQLRGLWTAINDPLGLEMERNKHRTTFKSIELNIRAAIEKAEALEK